ncbi:MAG: hypothetical protein KDD66_17970, partial [Bdellovibrionales bacterium]|nr:hypothetical protein [Bdellovibrionales bacterium]
NLTPGAQYHVDASALLSPGMSGAAKIVSSTTDGLIAQSMFYFRNSAGSIEGMYGSQSISANSGVKTSSWNLFLNMQNWLRVFNTTNTAQSVTVTTFLNGASAQHTVSLPPKTGTDIGLHNAPFNTTPNSFGLMTVSGNGLSTEMLRLKNTGSGGVDFIFPLAVR